MYLFRLVQHNGLSFGIPMHKNDPETTDCTQILQLLFDGDGPRIAPLYFCSLFDLFLKYYCSRTDLGVRRGGYLLSSSLGR